MIENGKLANQENLNAAFESKTKRAAANGYCPLDEDAKVPPENLPVKTYQNNIDLDNDTAEQTLTGILCDLINVREVIVEYQIYRKTDATDEISEIGTLRLSARPLKVVEEDKWLVRSAFKMDEGVVSGVTFIKEVVDGVLQLKASTTDLAGDDHECTFFYTAREISA